MPGRVSTDPEPRSPAPATGSSPPTHSPAHERDLQILSSSRLTARRWERSPRNRKRFMARPASERARGAAPRGGRLGWAPGRGLDPGKPRRELEAAPEPGSGGGRGRGGALSGATPLYGRSLRARSCSRAPPADAPSTPHPRRPPPGSGRSEKGRGLAKRGGAGRERPTRDANPPRPTSPRAPLGLRTSGGLQLQPTESREGDSQTQSRGPDSTPSDGESRAHTHPSRPTPRSQDK